MLPSTRKLLKFVLINTHILSKPSDHHIHYEMLIPKYRNALKEVHILVILPQAIAQYSVSKVNVKTVLQAVTTVH